MKGELVDTESAALWPKMYRYLTDDSEENKMRKNTIKCVVKRKLKIEDYKHCLEATQIENKINLSEKNNLSVII